MSILLGSLWPIICGIFIYKFYSGKTIVDDRVSIVLNNNVRALVQSEMRQFLEDFQGILLGVADENKNFIIESAKTVNVPASLLLKLRLEFKLLGMGVHKSFDKLSVDVVKMSSKETLLRVTEIMNSCIGCHLTYKLIENKKSTLKLG